MKRMTERDEYGTAALIALSDIMPKLYTGLSFSESIMLTAALNRLADYEDTGMEPGRCRLSPMSIPNLDWRTLYEQGFQDAEIAKELHCSVKAISDRRKQEGLPANRDLKQDVTRQKFRPLYDKGYCDGHIAREAGCSKTAVQKWRREQGLAFHKEPGFPTKKKPGALLCKTCVWSFHSGDSPYCDYLGLTGKRRGCPPPRPEYNECAKYEKNTRAVTSARAGKAREKYGGNRGLSGV